MVQTIVFYTELIPVVLAFIALLHIGPVYARSRRRSDQAIGILSAIICCVLIIARLSGGLNNPGDIATLILGVGCMTAFLINTVILSESWGK